MRLFLLLMFVPILAWAEYIDLYNATVLAQGWCEIEKVMLYCAKVEQDKKKYLILFDPKGELAQWELQPKGGASLVWHREII